MTRGSRVRLRDRHEHCAREKKKEIVEGIKIELLPATVGAVNNVKIEGKKSEDARVGECHRGV